MWGSTSERVVCGEEVGCEDCWDAEKGVKWGSCACGGGLVQGERGRSVKGDGMCVLSNYLRELL